MDNTEVILELTNIIKKQQEIIEVQNKAIEELQLYLKGHLFKEHNCKLTLEYPIGDARYG